MGRLRWTIRLRLTLLYGVLFLAAGALLLAVTYVLVAHTGFLAGIAAPPTPRMSPPSGTGAPSVPSPAFDLSTELAAQRARDLRQLLVASGIALTAMTVGSVGLGWLMAGRALRPLRTMADTARSISAHDLDRRLHVPGPADEIKDLADTVDGLLDRLHHAFEAQRRFVANASHELRTPLTLERSLLEVALADPDATAPDLREVCRRVLASNQRQGKLIEALLTMARSDRGLDRRTDLDLAVLAGAVVDASCGTAPSDLRWETDLEPAPTAGDAPLIERLIGNLIDNAVRHNVPNGAVTVRTGLDAGRPAVRVRNTGPVVVPDQLGELFEPFRRLHAVRTGAREGHGLGLSIVVAIAAAHDARLHAEPLPSGGLDVRVTFHLPATGIRDEQRRAHILPPPSRRLRRRP